jgi:hypothetical protein
VAQIVAIGQGAAVNCVTRVSPESNILLVNQSKKAHFKHVVTKQ